MQTFNSKTSLAAAGCGDENHSAPAALQKSASCLMSANSPTPTLLRVRSAKTGTASPVPRHRCSWRKGPSHWTTTAGGAKAASASAASGSQSLLLRVLVILLRVHEPMRIAYYREQNSPRPPATFVEATLCPKAR